MPSVDLETGTLTVDADFIASLLAPIDRSRMVVKRRKKGTGDVAGDGPHSVPGDVSR